MARIKLDMPQQMVTVCQLPVRITDINYGGHAGNNQVVALVHEARVQFLQQRGLGELQFWGDVGLIMNDLALVFKAELFYGEVVEVDMQATEFHGYGFDLYYRLTTTRNDKKILVAEAKTGMICYDYTHKRLAQLPEEARAQLDN